MKKDKNLMKFTSFVLLVVVIALILVAGTFAKYTSSASGESTAIVAKWSFLVNGTDITQLKDDKTIAFDLFSTINEENGGTEEDVAKATGENPSIIAPGTSGSFKLQVQNASEVTAKYTISFKVTDEEGNEFTDENRIPLQYYISDEEISDLSTISDEDWSDELTETSDTLAINSEEKAKIVYWKWPFEKTTIDGEGNEVIDADYDAHDTALGINPVTIMVKATITAEQYDATEVASGDDEEEDDDAPDPLTLLIDGVEVTDENQYSFNYAPGTTVTFSTAEGYSHAEWVADDLEEEYSGSFVDNGNGTATFTIPDGTAGSSWMFSVSFINSTGGMGMGSLRINSKNFEVGNKFTGDTSNEYGTSLVNIEISAGYGLALPSDSPFSRIYVYKQDSEVPTFTPEAELVSSDSSIMVEEEGWYGIVIQTRDGAAFEYETAEFYDLVQKSN